MGCAILSVIFAFMAWIVIGGMVLFGLMPSAVVVLWWAVTVAIAVFLLALYAGEA